MSERPRATRQPGVEIDLSGWGFDPLGIGKSLSDYLSAVLDDEPPSFFLCKEPGLLAVTVPLGRYSDNSPEWRIHLRDIVQDEIWSLRNFTSGKIEGRDEIARATSLADALEEIARELRACINAPAKPPQSLHGDAYNPHTQQ